MSRQLTLTAIWWGWGIILIVVLALLSGQPALFGDDTPKIWQWFLPNIIPTLTMVGASAYASQQTPAPSGTGPSFVLAVGASVLYLLLLSLAVGSTVVVSHPLLAVQQANLWLGPVQGLAASGLAIYFIRNGS